MKPVRIDVSIVSYFSDGPHLVATLTSLAKATQAFERAAQGTVGIVLFDNSENSVDTGRLQDMVQRIRQSQPNLNLSLSASGANLGYGGGNNAALLTDAGRSDEERYVLVLNPDVVLPENALSVAVSSLRRTSPVSMLVPRAVSETGTDLYLAHRYPDPLVFLIRAGAPDFVRRFWRYRLSAYEVRDLATDQPHLQTICASGCFMFMNRTTWQALNGFDDRYFLYFEDYDLSCRALSIGPIMYEPAITIQHRGGAAARKGGKHLRLFARSAYRFFRTYGWTRDAFEKRQERRIHVGSL